MMLSSPPDGWTQYERLILREVVIDMYSRIEDPIDKFIIMATFESNYRQEEIGRMFGISQVAVHKRIKKAQDFLKAVRKAGQL